mmetsp:Transcript_6414/g.14162  ORF Transcript_6414/g.14162 Transcript_6414/m.14162 type:complete len:200 (-) Transcript_6414:51-650(-)
MAARTGQLALLLLLAFLCGTHALAQGSSGEDTHFDFPMEDPDDDRNTTRNLQDVLTDAASDIQKTISTSEHPLFDLKAKYGASAQKGVLGASVGYAVARITKHFALSTLKVSAVGAVMYIGAAALGYIHKDPADIVDQLQNGAAQASHVILRVLDLNKDGKVDWKDAKIVGRRLERAILKNSVAASIGVAAGALFAIVS